MAITEKENNISIKERDRVEVYLMRIIARYFDNEYVYNKESIESIINESLQRYNQYLSTEHFQFIFSLNGRTGNINLDITCLGGEWKFDKKSAFNKDFGTIADTICKGNDPRLSDKRVPLAHKHEIADINGLEERLKALRPTYKTHTHRNKSLLDILRYSGTKTEFDLIILEELQVSLKYYLENVKFYQREEESLHKSLIEAIEICYNTLIELSQTAQKIVDDMESWLSEIEEYTDKEIQKFRNSFIEKLKGYLTQDQLKILKEYFSKVFILKQEGTVGLMGGTPEVKNIKKEVDTEVTIASGGDAMKDIFNNSAPIDKSGQANWIWDSANETIIETVNTAGWTGYVSLNKFSDYEHRVTVQSADSDDDFITVMLAYDDATQDNLQVVCRSCDNATTMGYSDPETYAALYYNFNDANEVEIARWNTGKRHSNGWQSNPKGFPMFIKRTGNTFQVWISCGINTPYIPDASNNINPSGPPTFTVNLDDHDYLKNLRSEYTRYGYGCYSQEESTYRDIWFKGTNIAPGQSEYDSTVNMHEINVIPLSGLTPAEIADGYLKTYLVYEENGKEYSMPLPMCLQRDGHYIIVQARLENSILKVDVNVSNDFPDVYCSADNIYNNNSLIVANINKNGPWNWENLCDVDTQEKFNFIKNIIPFNSSYMIKNLYDIDMKYTEWDTGEPKPPIYDAAVVVINNKYKMQTASNHDSYMAIQEFILNQLKDYFPNPRIHYQIFGTQEVT